MILIVVPSKRVDLLLRVVDRREPMHVQTLLAKPPVERFDRGIVGWFAPTTEIENHAVGIGPEIHRGTDELGAVVAVDALRQAALDAQALERRHDVATTEALADVDRQAFAREQIEHGQRAKAPAIRELIGHEVHAPNVVSCGRWSSLLAVDRRRMAPGSFASQRQAFLDVEPVAALLAELPAFAPQQHQQPPVTKAHARLRQLAHPLSQRRPRIAAALVANAGETEAGRADGPSLADLVSTHQVVHHFALPDRRQNFF